MKLWFNLEMLRTKFQLLQWLSQNKKISRRCLLNFKTYKKLNIEELILKWDSFTLNYLA